MHPLPLRKPPWVDLDLNNLNAHKDGDIQTRKQISRLQYNVNEREMTEDDEMVCLLLRVNKPVDFPKTWIVHFLSYTNTIERIDFSGKKNVGQEGKSTSF